MVVHTAKTGFLQRPCFIGFLSLLRQLAEREGLSSQFRKVAKNRNEIRLIEKAIRRFVYQ
ncbi:MAG: hypothetical protein QOH35_3081 [Acidobacteriaceae bacterium]|jgi:hypothetical protein|nr:hypothetical protein [Acidobacteriaceae bacterium]